MNILTYSNFNICVFSHISFILLSTSHLFYVDNFVDNFLYNINVAMWKKVSFNKKGFLEGGGAI